MSECEFFCMKRKKSLKLPTDFSRECNRMHVLICESPLLINLHAFPYYSIDETRVKRAGIPV